MSKAEIYFSCDIETDGPIPGPNSMLSLGSAAFAESGALLGTFEVNFQTLPEATPNPSTMEWWAKNQAAYDKTRESTADPEVGMRSFVSWINSLCVPPGAEKLSPVFVGYPAGFDFLFVYWYLIRFTGDSPFSFSALDIKTYAMRALKLRYRDSVKRNFPQAWFPKDRPHTHVALDDALEQGELFMNMLKSGGQTR